MKTPPAGSPLSSHPRRAFLRTTALVGAAASLGRLDGSAWALDGAAGGTRRPRRRGSTAHALGAAHAGRGRPGEVRPRRSGSTTSSAPTPTRSASAPAAAWPTTRRRSRSTTAARGWATATCSASWSPAAGSWAWSSSRAPIPHATYDDVQAAHPDWIAVDAEGQPRRHWASPEMWVTCGLGPYNFEFMTEVKREIMTRYRVDGIFINRWDGSGMCYCEHCQTNFRAATGLELPRTDGPAGPGAARLPAVAAGAALRRCGGSGTRRSARSTPTPASSPTPAAARPARST